MARPYYRANPNATSGRSPEKTPKHEALHAAVAHILGYEADKIRINKDGSGIVERKWEKDIGWHRAAIHLAPVLIDDLASTDAEHVATVNAHTRGYAWGWLKQNRRRILRRANEIVSKMGRPGGTLQWTEDGTWKWRPRKKVKRK